ncbi:cation diffusion facilitator family transporter [Planotetraspora sp. A-T 1434]|uniref:cation diffusion facilitator family transporter n=1 Tax=Planotetraspora sp. A-T 1434 TaxID=2979219 RepID=UPI0021C1FCE3|nr:cation diffusion facilitator family transporter [Planotetraspora sp. A-T 1434]MCT9930405.1 cation diffusion facilitator family transporter [Planotetraspora sp. A-T 1434]
MTDHPALHTPAREHGEHSHEHKPGQEKAHGHGHVISAEANRRCLAGALALIVGFMAAEVMVGLIARSLALISDAGHMLTDACAIVFALVAVRIAARPPQGGFTYGLKRAEIVSAQANGITLLLLAVYFLYEGVNRLVAPPSVQGGYLVATGLAGVVVNFAASWLLSRANRTSLNVEGAFQHILNDLYAFIATTVAGAVIVLTGWARADAIAALVVAVLMLKAGWGLVREAGRVFMEAAPVGVNPAELGRKAAALADVAEVHDLHIWEVTSGYPAMSAHVLVTTGADCHAVRQAVEHLVHHDYGIRHTTLQVDHAPAELLTLAPATAAPATAAGGAHCADPHGPAHRPEPPLPRRRQPA